jgi:hypothetical protein
VLRAAVGLEAEPARRPVMVIDDADPDAAERRREAERDDSTWKSFIPPVLLDTEQGSRRGALTLAVIILVIVATLTMSYLMRQPDESGDGVTFRDSASDGVVPGDFRSGVIPSVIEAPRGSYDELS